MTDLTYSIDSKLNVIDIAVIKRLYSEPTQNDILIKHSDIYPSNLDVNAIDADVFKVLFYNQGSFSPLSTSQIEALTVNGQAISTSTANAYKDIMSLNTPKTIDQNELDMPELLIRHIENGDLTATPAIPPMPREMFTRCSAIELTKSLNSLSHFSDIMPSTTPSDSELLCKLTWDEITRTIRHLSKQQETGTYRAQLRITVFLESKTVSNPLPPFGVSYNFNVKFSIPII